MEDNFFNGLQPYLCLARGAKVMIIHNIWTKVGLVNGATGVIRHFIFEKGVIPPALPLAIVVEMDEPYNGPHLLGKPRLVLILFYSDAINVI